MTAPGTDMTIDQTILRWTGHRGFEATVSSLALDDKEILFQTRLRGLVDATYSKPGARRSLGFARLPVDLDEKQRYMIFCRGAEQVTTRASAVTHVLTGGPKLDAGVALGLADGWRGGSAFSGRAPELSGWQVPESESSGLPDRPAPDALPPLDVERLREIARLRLDDWKHQARHADFAMELTRLVEGLLRAGDDRLAVYECQSDPVVLLAAAREILRNYVSADWSFSTGESQEKPLFRITFLLPGTHAAAVGQYVELDREGADSPHWLDARKLVEAYRPRSTADWAEDLATAGVEDKTSLLEWVRTNPTPSRRQLEHQLVELPTLRVQLRTQSADIERLATQRQADETTMAGLRGEIDRQKVKLKDLQDECDGWRNTATRLQAENTLWADESKWLTDSSNPSKRKAANFQLLGSVAEILFGLRDRVALWETEKGQLADRRLRDASGFQVLGPVAEELVGLRARGARLDVETKWLLDLQARDIGLFQVLGPVAQVLFGLRDRVALWEAEAGRLGDRRLRDASGFQVLGPVAEELVGLRSDLVQWKAEAGWLVDRRPPAGTEFRLLQPTALELFGLRADRDQWQLEAGLLFARQRPAPTEFRMLGRAAQELFEKIDTLAQWENEAKLLNGRSKYDASQFTHLRRVADQLNRLRSGQAHLDARSELERWQTEQQWILQGMVANPEVFGPLQPVAAWVFRLMTEHEAAGKENQRLQQLTVELQYGQKDWYEYAVDLQERIKSLRWEVAALELAAARPEPSVHGDAIVDEPSSPVADGTGTVFREGAAGGAIELFEAWGIGEGEQPRRILEMFDGRADADPILLDAASRLRTELPEVLAQADWRGLADSAWHPDRLDSAFRQLVHLAFGTVASVDAEADRLLRESLRQTFRNTGPTHRKTAAKLYRLLVEIAQTQIWTETRSVANEWIGRLQNGTKPPDSWQQMDDEVKFRMPGVSGGKNKSTNQDANSTVARRSGFVAFVQKNGLGLTVLFLGSLVAVLVMVLMVTR